jgi:hypothetical protein
MESQPLEKGSAGGLAAGGLSVRRAPEARSHERGAVPSGASLAAETGECAGEESRLKAGCSQDWLPHKDEGCDLYLQNGALNEQYGG